MKDKMDRFEHCASGETYNSATYRCQGADDPPPVNCNSHDECGVSEFCNPLSSLCETILPGFCYSDSNCAPEETCNIASYQCVGSDGPVSCSTHE